MADKKARSRLVRGKAGESKRQPKSYHLATTGQWHDGPANGRPRGRAASDDADGLTLFDAPSADVDAGGPRSLAPVITPADPNVCARERPRLCRKARAVLARLQRGPASNVELAEVGGLRWSARIYDLRRAGWGIGIVERDHATGRCVYALRGVAS